MFQTGDKVVIVKKIPDRVGWTTMMDTLMQYGAPGTVERTGDYVSVYFPRDPDERWGSSTWTFERGSLAPTPQQAIISIARDFAVETLMEKLPQELGVGWAREEVGQIAYWGEPRPDTGERARKRAKVSTFISSFAHKLNQEVSKYTIETVANNWAKYLTQFEFFLDKEEKPPEFDYVVVSGGEVYEAYQTPIPDSCMVETEYPMWYAANPDKVKMVLIYDKGHRRHFGRALLWTTDDNRKFLDRIYPGEKLGERQDHLIPTRQWATRQGWLVRGGWDIGELRVTMSNLQGYDARVGGHPYMDTLKYIENWRDDHPVISNKRNAEAEVLDDTEGAPVLGASTCADCGDHMGRNGQQIASGARVCEVCAEENYTYVSGYGLVYHEDVVWSAWEDEYILLADAVSLLSGEYCLERDAVRIGREWYHRDDEDIVEIDGEYYHRDDDHIVEVDGEWYTKDEDHIVEVDGEWYTKDDDHIVKTEWGWCLYEQTVCLYDGRTCPDYLAIEVGGDFYHAEEWAAANPVLLDEGGNYEATQG